MIRAALNAWERQEFDYGKTDCCQFASFIVNHITGVDYSAGFHYDNESDALALIAKHDNLEGLISSIIGEPSDEFGDGDPVLCDLPVAGDTMGIKYGDGAVCITQKGMIQVPNKYIVRGWGLCHKP